jgi:hypothetical protein
MQVNRDSRGGVQTACLARSASNNLAAMAPQKEHIGGNRERRDTKDHENQKRYGHLLPR